MKNILTLCLYMLPILIMAQSNPFHIDSCGLNNASFLNQHEVDYFNTLVPSHINFDFAQKNVAFVNDHKSISVMDKQQYFVDYGKVYYYDNSQINHSIMVLTNEEKARTGFDVVVITLPESSKKEHKRSELLDRISH